MNDMNNDEKQPDISCYFDTSNQRFLIIRNMRIIEISEVSLFFGKQYVYKQELADSAPCLYKTLMLLADVLLKSFPDRKSADDFIQVLQTLPPKENPGWMNDCLLKLDGGIKKDKS